MGTPSFITQLRTHIGHDLLWLIGAECVIVRSAPRTEVLLVQRADNGIWTNVAGIVEPGEHPRVTVVREAEEEASVQVAAPRLLWVRVSEQITYPNGDQCQYLDHGFVADWLTGEARVGDDESMAVGWFAPDALPSPIAPRAAELIDLALAPAGDVVLG